MQSSNDSTMSYTVTNAAGGAHFYRVQVQP